MRSISILAFLSFAACANDYDLYAEKGDEDAAADAEETPEFGGTGSADTANPDTTDTGTIDVNQDDPVAVCSVSPSEVRPIVDTAVFNGASSYDPAGGTITAYTWSLVSKPTGSAENMPGGASANRSFTPDLAGEYVGRLVVRTSDGRTSAPCETTLTAVPVENLWIEMYWQYADDDMDLHLVRPGGSLLSNDDCYFANCTFGLDWGTWGDSSDNPTLDLDDISGAGPENINIEYPENGQFTVYVHDYQYSTGDTPSSNTATVNIYVGGVLEWTGSYTFSASEENAYIPYATINWPAGTVSSLL